ncbi:hypothetical protein DFS34DRAFT_114550 [Phlyctochytrium arcticum]|nr:hypothetical protein DFS34DRAFT_114550 [Phlyctochytrium arcticum]
MNKNPKTVLDVSKVEDLAASYQDGMRAVSSWSILNKQQKEKAVKQCNAANTSFKQPPIKLLLTELANNLKDKQAQLEIDGEVTENAVTVMKASTKRMLKFLDTTSKKTKLNHPADSAPRTPPRQTASLDQTPKKPFGLGATSPTSVVSSEAVELECENASTIQKRLRGAIQAKDVETDPWIFGTINLHQKMKAMQTRLLNQVKDKQLEVPLESLNFLTSSSVVLLSEALPLEYQSTWTKKEWQTMRTAFSDRRVAIDPKIWSSCLSEAEQLVTAKLEGRAFYAKFRRINRSKSVK